MKDHLLTAVAALVFVLFVIIAVGFLTLAALTIWNEVL